MAKRRIDPESRALWAEQRRQLQERIDDLAARIQEDRERKVRRKARLQRFTFGLLGR
jgi:hypothetical protein